MPSEHRKNISIQAAVITVSTTQTEKTDLSGQIIRDAFTAVGIPVVSLVIVKDDVPTIRTVVPKALQTAL